MFSLYLDLMNKKERKLKKEMLNKNDDYKKENIELIQEIIELRQQIKELNEIVILLSRNLESY